MMKPFTEHPHQQGVTYFEHWHFAIIDLRQRVRSGINNLNLLSQDELIGITAVMKTVS